jgi:hypothetical protein
MATQVQTSTTSVLQKMSRIMLVKARETEEHNMPVVNLIERFNLPKGTYQLDIPKVGTMTASDLDEGIDMTDTEDINPAIVSATTAEVGLKVIVTDILLRQNNESVFSIIGRQMGTAMARKKDTDAIALFVGLNGGTEFGDDNTPFSIANASACIAKAKANLMGAPLFIVHHPNAIFEFINDFSAPIASSGVLPKPFAADALMDFWTGIKVSGVPFFEDGNISKIGATDAGYGVIANKNAMGYLVARGKSEERQRDISLRAWEIVVTEDYSMFEVDDSLGAALEYEIGDITTSA